MELAGATIVDVDVHRWYARINTTLPDGSPYAYAIWTLAGDGLASGSLADFEEFQEREGW